MEKTKVCTKCKQRKPLSGFALMKRGVDGKASWCKACVNADHKKRKKERASRGDCTLCGAKKPNDGFKTCKKCRIYHTERERKMIARGLCPQCSKTKPKDKYRLCDKCREKKRAYFKEYRKTHDRFWSLRYRLKQRGLYDKLGSKCERCGYEGMALCFHHLTSEKDHPWWYKSENLETLIKEKKIQLLCRNCHVELHYGFNGWAQIFNTPAYNYVLKCQIKS